MFDVNEVLLVGRLGRDAEMKTTQGGTNYTRFSMATSKGYKDATGNWQNTTTWHNVVCWGKTAEAAAQLKKGHIAMVRGAIETRKYTGKDGVEKTSFEIKADSVREVMPMAKKQESATDQAPMSTDINGVPYDENSILF